MKSKFTFIFACLFLLAGVRAWAADSPADGTDANLFTHTTDDLATHVGEVFYLYNVGSGAYVTYGADYGTRAVMGPVGYPMYLRLSGANYKFEFVTSPKHNGDTHNLFYTNGNVYTDNTTNAEWTCTYDDESQAYTIVNTTATTTYLAVASADYLHNSNSGNGFKTGGKFHLVMGNVATNDDYAKWRFVTPKQKALLDLSNLIQYVTDKSLGVADLSSYTAMRDNSSSTTTDLTTAVTNLKEEIYALASTSSPLDVSKFTINNPNFEYSTFGSMDGWIVSPGTMQTQNNNGFNTMTDVGVGFVEFWQSSGSMPTTTLKQTLTSLPAGKYKLVAAMKGAGSSWTGVSLYAGSYSTSVTTVPTTATDIESPEIIINSDGSSIDIGIAIGANSGANWVAVDNFRLFYYGPLTEPMLIVDKTSLALSSVKPDGTFTIEGINLTGNITITAPAGITLSQETLVPTAGTMANTEITVAYDGITEITDDNITVSSEGAASKTINVNAVYTTNRIYGWDGNGTGVATDIPSDFGWACQDASVTWSTAGNADNYTYKYRDGLATDISRIISHPVNNNVFSFPIVLAARKMYSFSCLNSNFNYNKETTALFGINTASDATGIMLASQTQAPGGWGITPDRVTFSFHVPVVTSGDYYMVWQTFNGYDRNFAWAFDMEELGDLVIVTFDSNGGSDVDTQYVLKGSETTAPAEPTKEGYTFAGWYNGETEWDFDDAMTADLTMTAKWDVSTSMLNALAAGFEVYPVDGGIVIKSGSAQEINVYSAAGQLIKRTTVAGSETISLPPGWYIVNNAKVVVK